MRTTSTTSDDAIAAFLKAELDSPTESGRVRAALARLGLDERVVSSPDITNAAEGMQRWSVFDLCRGGEALFETLDLRALDWVRARLSAEDLRNRVRTCRHHFESEFGTRDPGTIAGILNGRGDLNDVLDRVRNGEALEPPLLVSTPSLEQFVILEGHNRIIAYLRDPSVLPRPIPVIIGFSDAVAGWREWP
ncbi:MAG: hypothetical protein ACYTG5_22845 [Planctomycetota bacterium]|jgi:hypothetical protein